MQQTMAGRTHMRDGTTTKIIDSAGLATFVAKRRRELGLTQELVALGANVSRRFVYDLEHGKPALQFDKVCKVLVILSVDVMLQGR
jgi:predicted transcriptional regulator